MDAARQVDQVIKDHLSELSKPGVLSIRPGYAASGGWLTKKPAIVVTVADKTDAIGASRLPETLGGFPVDVRQGDALQKMRASSPNLFTGVMVSAPPEVVRPSFPFQRDLDGHGALLQPIADILASRRTGKPQIPYEPPQGGALDEVDADLTLTCHASPDAGRPTLEPFLTATTDRLTVGMYDFTSGHILATLEGVLSKTSLSLVLDHPAPNKTRDQKDEDTVTALRGAGGQLSFAWALERNDPKAAKWIYPNAYHIKVAVRDGTAFWLSSGNWNNSNQPAIDPIADPSGSMAIAKKSDRDWHVIVEHGELAATFEAYLLNDLAVAKGNQAVASDQVLSAGLAELAQPMLSVTPRTFKEFLPPRQITERIRTQPILTPDNYVARIVPFIASAKRSFWMQTQYIHPSDKAGDEGLAALIEAVAQNLKRGIDVRLIMSQWETMDKLELLQDAGIDLSAVRIQANVHNKGMIVDGAAVAVGSQNWSGDGVLRNRDATLIIYNEKAADYFGKIFLHDWTNMAVQHASD